MIIHNPILTGSLQLNGTSLSTGNIVTTGSNTFVGNQVVSGSLNLSGSITATGTLTAQTLVVQTVTSSVVYSSGSNVFGNVISNTHQFTGSMSVSGSGTFGALSGTSATFSSTITNNVYSTPGSIANPFFNDVFLLGTTNSYSKIQWGNEFNSTYGTYLRFIVNGTSNFNTPITALTLLPSGAATFSSSVTAQSYVVNGLLTAGLIGANTSFLDQTSSGTARWLSYGSNSTTRGGFSLYQASSANTLGQSVLDITSDGNVGIGTTSPINSNRLTILMDGGTNGTGLAIRAVNNGGGGSQPALSFYNGSGDYIAQIVGDNGTGYLAFNTGTSNTERMRITSGGNLTIGFAASVDDCRVYIRSADNGSTNNGLLIQNPAGSSLFRVRNDGAIYTGVAANSPVNLTTSSAANVFVESGSGLLYRSTSSLKYKNSVTDYDKGLDIVNQLRPVYYKGNNDGDTIFAGLIAEEIHDLGLTEFVQYADDGTPDALSYSNMVALAFKAIQEQNQLIQELQSQINELKSK